MGTSVECASKKLGPGFDPNAANNTNYVRGLGKVFRGVLRCRGGMGKEAMKGILKSVTFLGLGLNSAASHPSKDHTEQASESSNGGAAGAVYICHLLTVTNAICLPPSLSSQAVWCWSEGGWGPQEPQNSRRQSIDHGYLPSEYLLPPLPKHWDHCHVPPCLGDPFTFF